MQKTTFFKDSSHMCGVCGAPLTNLELVIYSHVCQGCVNAVDISVDGAKK